MEAEHSLNSDLQPIGGIEQEMRRGREKPTPPRDRHTGPQATSRVMPASTRFMTSSRRGPTVGAKALG